MKSARGRDVLAADGVDSPIDFCYPHGLPPDLFRSPALRNSLTNR